MEDNQQFIEGLRDRLSKFFKLYDEYDRASTTHEKVKVLEDIASLFYPRPWISKPLTLVIG